MLAALGTGIYAAHCAGFYCLLLTVFTKFLGSVFPFAQVL